MAETFARTICKDCNGPMEYPTEMAGQSILCPHCQQRITLILPSDRKAYSFWVPKSWFLRIPLILLYLYLGLIAAVAVMFGEIGMGLGLVLSGLFIHWGIMSLRKALATWTKKKSLSSASMPVVNQVLKYGMANRKLLRNVSLGFAAVCMLLWLTPKVYHRVQQFSQARDPVMRQRTMETWRQIQGVEAALSQQGGNPGTRAYAYSQLNLQQVDPKVVHHVVAVVNASREYHQLQETISSEVSAKSRGRAEAAQAVQLFGGLLGLVASGETRSLSEVERNLSAGLASGGFVGNAMSSFQENSMWNEIKSKYGQRIDAYENGIKQFANDRVTLAAELTKKYQEPFMSAY